MVHLPQVSPPKLRVHLSFPPNVFKTYTHTHKHRHQGTRCRSWLRRCATSRKVMGSIPDGVIGIFHWHNHSSRTMALGSTQPLIEMSTRNISWGVGRGVKVARAYGWQPYHLHVPTVSKFGSLNLLEPSGPVICLYRDCFAFIYIHSFCLLAHLKVARAM